MKFISGLLVGAVLSVGSVSLYAQRGEVHPRLAKAIEALRDARAYMEGAPHDFGGHRVDAIRATDEAIKQLEFARAYRERR
jgi:hypothetical protein